MSKVFASLDRAASETLQTCLGTQVGMEHVPQEGLYGNTGLSTQVKMWLDFAEWLDQQTAQYAQALVKEEMARSEEEEEQEQGEQGMDVEARNTSSMSVLPTVSTNTSEQVRQQMEAVQAENDALRDRLYALATQQNHIEAVERRILQSSVLQSLVFGNEDDLSVQTETMIQEMGVRDDKTIQLNKLLAKLEAVEGKVAAAQRENQVALTRNRGLHNTLEALKNTNNDNEQETSRDNDRHHGDDDHDDGTREGLAEQRRALRKLQTADAYVRNVMQAVVLQSGVNWAKDEVLREFMLNVDRPEVWEE